MALELVERAKLIKGEKYYVKRKRITKNMKFHAIFDRDDFEGFGFVWFRIDTKFIELDTKLNIFYRCISKEEFYAKVKEKYDAKVLNIILKRLVDENFKW